MPARSAHPALKLGQSVRGLLPGFLQARIEFHGTTSDG